MHQPDEWGCGYYRAVAPVYNCFESLSERGINIVIRDDLRSDETYYDAYIFHRMPNDTVLKFTQYAKEGVGRKIAWSLDDDLWNVPDYCINKLDFADRRKLELMGELSDYIIVSTPYLAKQTQFPEKTIVAPNFADVPAFDPFLHGKLSDSPIRIVWAGSCFHEEDLQLVIEPVKELIEEFGDEVTFVFFGYLPTEFVSYERRPGTGIGDVTVKDYGVSLAYLPSVQFRYYFDRLLSLRPHIGIAPLLENVFNNAKSNCKFLEYSLAGAATIATNTPPYHCIEHEKTGLLVDPGDSDGWKKAIRRLIKDPDFRAHLAANAKKTVKRKYSWTNPKNKKIWLDMFTRLVDN